MSLSVLGLLLFSSAAAAENSCAEVLAEVRSLKSALKELLCNPNGLRMHTLDNGETYFFSTTHVGSVLNWYGAMQFCKSNKMDLASPKTKEELTLLVRKSKEIDAEATWHLSATDAGRERGDFRWADGEVLPLNSSLWLAPHANFRNFLWEEKLCVYIDPEQAEKLQLHNCVVKSHIICQLPAKCK
ncbi:Hypothetical predicted protein [Cloeon dipterum]|uniref:C-type lectin domain-containing protein n=1 Tax=Cloeon dipterum TaxID=197152 RepID=A0A8S1DZ93_9INSE|nr:Hypothetical predicted protein [Cloeon dipterum]